MTQVKQTTSTDYLTSDIREFRMVKKPLSQEEMDSAIDLKEFKPTVYNNEDDYRNAFEDMVFKYGKKYYKYRFKFGIKTRFIGENLLVMGILSVKSNSPDINDFKTNVKNHSLNPLFCFISILIFSYFLNYFFSSQENMKSLKARRPKISILSRET